MILKPICSVKHSLITRTTVQREIKAQKLSCGNAEVSSHKLTHECGSHVRT